MERTASYTGNHLHSVGQILFDGAETEAQHLTVIERGLGESPSPGEWTAVLDYAQEHLSEGPLIDVQLTVAERISGVAPPSAADQEYKQPAYQSEDRGANTIAMAQVLNNLDSIASSPQELEDGTLKRMLRLMDMVRHAYPDRYLHSYVHADEAVADLRPQPGERIHGRWAAAAGSLIEATSKKLDDRNISFWSAASKSLDNEAGAIYSGRISGLAVRVIDRIVEEADDPAKILGKEPYKAYLDEAASLKTTYYNHGYEDGQHNVDVIVDKAVSCIGVDTPDAVKALLELHNDVPNLEYSRKESMLDRAIEITKASSRDPRMRFIRGRFFGFARFVELPSQFENRRNLLESQVGLHFHKYIAERPAVINKIFELYDTAEVDGIQQLTDVFAKKLANRAFTNGHYDPQVISGIPREMARLRRLIPEAVVEEAEDGIRENLAKSTPIGSAAESN